jgi:hypothetical protein
MNYRSIIFSGIMAALIGAMIGLAISHIAQRVERRRILVIGGATLGFVIGAFQQSIIEEKKQRNDSENTE